MTQEEQTALEQLNQRQESDMNFRREARMKAVHIARDMKPVPEYSAGQRIVAPEKYDLLKEAEAIYQWLIKSE